MKKPLQGVPELARALAVRSRRSGSLELDELDAYLAAGEEFEERVASLLPLLGALPLGVRGSDQLAPPAPLIARSASPRLPANGDDDLLRSYLRAIHQRPRLEKDEERELAKRFEFARRRFAEVVAAARMGGERLRELLGNGLTPHCAEDLGIGLVDGAAGRPLAESRRREIAARAAEMNRARADFVERTLPVVANLALCYRTYGVPLMDLIHEGNGALIRAVEKFDWRKEVRFATYATFWIRQAVERSIAFNKGIVRVPNYLQQKMRRLRREGVLPKRDRDASLGEVSAAFSVKREVASHLLQTQRTHCSLDAALDEDGETFASLLADQPASEARELEFPLLRRRLEEVLCGLPPLERKILELRFGLAGGEPVTLEELGRQMKVSRERVRQLQCRAIRHLQSPPLRQRLSGFV